MVFSSPSFLFYFFPLTLLGYFFALRLSLQAANIFLLIASLVFYAWGELHFLPLFLCSILFNYGLAWLLSSFKPLEIRQQRIRLILFITGLAINLGTLVFFKYGGFFATLLEPIFGSQSLTATLKAIRLPLGISFFTFHGLSYLFDVYRGTIPFRRGIVNLGLYIALFPQLIAGPIVRYKEIFGQFLEREHSASRFSEGAYRFVIGLSKKILVANQLATVADFSFSLPAEQLDVFSAWIGMVCYSLQIYFDFSGYSDMAIGLAAMFGFQFPENFRLPYTAKSIREFWQRWHISLSGWFRDYLYIPLGGNRGTPLQTARNLITVFFLCGLWHGASWNFIIWGLLHGAFLSLERTGFGEMLDASSMVIRRAYTLLVVMFLWVPFRADTLQESWCYWRALLAIETPSVSDPYLFLKLTNQVSIALVIAILFGLGMKLPSRGFFRPVMAALLLLLSLSEVAAGSYSPFIYFRF